MIAPDDVESLTGALNKVYSADVKTMGKQAQAFAQDFFSPEKYVAGYKALFNMADNQ